MALPFAKRLEKGAKRVIFSALRLMLPSRQRPAPGRGEVHRILVIRQHNQLGDMLCAVPLLRALRAAWPTAHIALLARPLNGEILTGATWLDEVIVYDKKAVFRGILPLLRFRRDLKSRRFDLVLVPSPVAMSVTSDMLAWISGARHRIGPASLQGKKNLTHYLFTIRQPLDWREDETVHQTQRNLDIAASLHVTPPSLELALGLSEQEIVAGREFLEVRRGSAPFVIGFHPGAAKIPNRWDALRFAEIANRCAEILGAAILITAGPNDEEPLREMTLNVPNDCIILQNEPIRFVASVVRHCDLFVTNDTGIMHVAAAAGAPTLSLFGPTDPLQWAPLGTSHRFILGKGGAMEAISVEKVWSVLNEMLVLLQLSQPEMDMHDVEVRHG